MLTASPIDRLVLLGVLAIEIAESAGISRQGVHDLIKRCNKLLEGYEAKLHLVEKFLSVKKKVQEINELLDLESEDPVVQNVRQIAVDILEEL